MTRAAQIRPDRSRRLRGDAGFMLLEALVAVAIMAFILSVLPSSVVISRQSVQKSADVVGARLVAEAVLVNEFAGPNVSVGTRTGTIDGYEWSILVQPRGSLEERFPSRNWTPYDVSVSVLVPGGRTVTVDTIRLGRGG